MDTFATDGEPFARLPKWGCMVSIHTPVHTRQMSRREHASYHIVNEGKARRKSEQLWVILSNAGEKVSRPMEIDRARQELKHLMEEGSGATHRRKSVRKKAAAPKSRRASKKGGVRW